MSDVENAISGNNFDKQCKYQQTATTGTTTTTAAVTAANEISAIGSSNSNSNSSGNSNSHTATAITRIANVNLTSATPTTTTTKALQATSDYNATNYLRAGKNSKLNNCLGFALKLIFSTPGLIALVIVYSVFGALLFPMLEAPQDINRLDMIARSREDCLRELWIITEKLNVLYERNWTMLVHEQLRRFEGTIVAATRHNGGGGGNALGHSSHGNVNPLTNTAKGTTTQVSYFNGNYDGYFGDGHWTFSEALLYSVTVITTIGHGSLTPKTAAGKIATILYALIGVPLMLMCLSSLGALLAEALQCTYTRLCCRFVTHHANASDSSNHHKQQHQQQQQQQQGRAKRQQRRCGNSGNNVDNDEEVDDVNADMADDDCVDIVSKHESNAVAKQHVQSHQQKQQQQQFLHEYHGQGNGMLYGQGNKYDAIINEKNENNGYDYPGNYKTTIGRNEECCQLLHSSPVKVNHQAGTCMQMKTMGAAGQYYQRTAQQQQQQQQPAKRSGDIMLMTTLGQIKNHAFGCTTRSATTSPQHQHLLAGAEPSPPPLQTFQLLATTTLGAGNASPTHHLLQPQKQFVAVPGGILRLPAQSQAGDQQAANNASAATAATTAYMPASHATTATIYLPIITTSGAAPPNAQLNGPTAATATATQYYYNQPVVKYHTLHMPEQQKKANLIDIGEAAASDGGSSELNAVGSDIALDSDVNGLPLPPPPAAYQTATVHGIRRGKFVTKPLPQEINTIFAETDMMSHRQQLQANDLAHSFMSAPATVATFTTTAATGQTAASVSFSPNTITTTFATDDAVNAGAIASTITATTTAADALGSTGTVDIMEDEEENEQQRLGTCPHGTPSRVPLIAQNGSTAQQQQQQQQQQHQHQYNDKSTRGLLNATAASFHRHTLHSFHRGRQQQQQQRNCQMHCHNTQTLNRKHNHLFGGSATHTKTTIAINNETSDDDYEANANRLAANDDDDDDDEDDDDAYVRHDGSEEFMLERIDAQSHKNASAESEDDGADANVCQSAGPQVPISLVLLILLCYICLGTIIFALWENWSVIDGAYFCFVTLTTIGYGDFIPARTFNGPDVQLFACCAYLILGLVLVAMFFSILETQLMWKCRRIAVRLKLATD